MILLVRHADAVPESAGLYDEHRFLSRGGRASARALAGEMRAAGLTVEHVLSSPLVRAVQTAELIVIGLGLDVEVEASALLSPGGSVRQIAGRLGVATGLTIAVGHEPSISALAGVLVSDRAFPSMRKAEACLIEAGSVRRWFGSDRQ